MKAITRTFALFQAFLFIFIFPPAVLTAESLESDSAKKVDRIALVIGNGKYEAAPLSNSVNDAQAIAKALRSYGFEVTERINANQGTMRRAIRDFGDRLRRGGVGLFYFAGHGMQVNGRNYLIPIGADIRGEDDIEDQAT